MQKVCASIVTIDVAAQRKPGFVLILVRLITLKAYANIATLPTITRIAPTRKASCLPTPTTLLTAGRWMTKYQR